MRYVRRNLWAAVVLLAAPALAQHAEHVHGVRGPNGGRVEDAGPWHAELLAKGGTVAVYVSDASGKPLSPAGFNGTAILIASGRPLRIPLAPEGDRLAGKAPAPLDPAPKGAVRLSGPGGISVSAKFD